MFSNEEAMRKNFKAKFGYFQENWLSIYGINGSLVLNYILRQYFNLRKNPNVNPIAMDPFMFTDLVYAISSSVLFGYITTQKFEFLLDKNTKNYVDWLVSIVIILAYMRLFILFLVIPSISKMLLTLLTMFKDVANFFIIMVCYIFAVTQIF